jgi:50S ribosomal protein L16 3-hydroxylase
VLKLPGNLTAETFLKRHWQKRALLMPAALARVRPSITRNELAWLATLPDVESRLIFVDRTAAQTRYRAETGPFDPEYLALFRHVSFIPDWRIDDLMVSFAAPGGGVGPHRDHYDVFLCQGIGVRNWKFTRDEVLENPQASDDLSLLDEFTGEQDADTVEGDVLYLPPGVAHWGVSKRACMTYSIGLRAPQVGDFSTLLKKSTAITDDFYRDPDLTIDEARPGYIAEKAAKRASALLDLPAARQDDVARIIGEFATQSKDWLAPECATPEEAEMLLDYLRKGGGLRVHGMTQIAFDDRNVYVNGKNRELAQYHTALVADLCANRVFRGSARKTDDAADLLRWLSCVGTFELPENL